MKKCRITSLRYDVAFLRIAIIILVCIFQIFRKYREYLSYIIDGVQRT